MNFIKLFFFCCIFLSGESFIRYQLQSKISPIRFNIDIRYQRLRSPSVALPLKQYLTWSRSSTAKYGVLSSMFSWVTNFGKKRNRMSTKDNKGSEQLQRPLTIEEKKRKLEEERIEEIKMMKFEEHIQNVEYHYRSIYEHFDFPELDYTPKPNEFRLIQHIALSLPQPYRNIYLNRKREENEKLKDLKVKQRNRKYFDYIEKSSDEIDNEQEFIDKCKDADKRYEEELRDWSRLAHANPEMILRPPIIDDILLNTPGLEKCADPGWGYRPKEESSG
jgi:hypothetical protein